MIHCRDIQMIEAQPLDCYGDEETGAMSSYWQHGLSILNIMRVIKRIPGLSREIEFDTYGRRTKFELDIVNLFEKEGLVKVGSWDDKSEIMLHGKKQEGMIGGWEGSLLNRSLVVTTILNPPYMMIKESTVVLGGNEQYEGFVPDMVDILSKKLSFNYTLRVGNKFVFDSDFDQLIPFFHSC